MSTPYLGEVRLFPYVRIPSGWTPCEGQVLQILDNRALFFVIGSAYGGDGHTTFALPDLRGRVPIHAGMAFTPGTSGGEASHTLLVNEMPAHTHQASASSDPATTADPANAAWAQAYSPYAEAMLLTPMNPGAISQAGGGQAHENMQPYLALVYCMATTGNYPE
ncbi:phage tail protein [Cohnella zeiphila]|uniref:Phage tail protein n=1 Tax=Cohnella zeiphila TaxID=2761120 RepID=A0A7X0SUP6_9BACL|nr:tail fiber protein [Cohnella zeiphila]MBB6735255.1 phage tail protein [Cohnella zeiphila]